ncbi:MAG: cyclic pyranopterin phosphate synthase MoaA, partial [Phaeodactylibacter sp.]|nr:cyclic pyranopterin phosphate synthase MoaA [Phaeodactylibacter sp.]
HIHEAFPELEKLDDGPFSTSSNFRVKGFAGTIGTIAAFSRTFCGTCNRIRITPKGLLKTCLYDNGVFNVRDVLRAGANDDQLRDTFLQALGDRAKDGYEAEQRRGFGNTVSESMSTIGG